MYKVRIVGETKGGYCDRLSREFDECEGVEAFALFKRALDNPRYEYSEITGDYNGQVERAGIEHEGKLLIECLFYNGCLTSVWFGEGAIN